MKKYDRYLFFMSLVMAFLSVAAMPGIPGLVTNIYAAEPFDGIPIFSAGTTPYLCNFRFTVWMHPSTNRQGWRKWV